MSKRRTREHIISDLSVNHFEHLVLLEGHTAERIIFDYGYDLAIRTFDANGYAEPNLFFVQLKATDKPDYRNNGAFLAVRLEDSDIRAWRREYMPVILVIYDATIHQAFWVHFQALADTTLKTFLIPTTQRVNSVSVREMQTIKNNRILERNNESI